VQRPPFEQVGVFDLETFYPAKDRMKLAMSLNQLLASPGFAAWREGEPLDVGRLLHTAEGKPRVTVLSIAHLGDAERMFFVTALLNEVIVWMRRQSGTSSLRALLYMDEIFGYFPPTANPPSKAPMLTLLKQARAYGLGVVLSTQNPVDLDYKGLGNCGTWFLGRLQTERDKQRVLDGLEGAAAGSGTMFDRSQTESILSGLANRVFLMRNVHDDRPVLFETRWVMGYLRGPLTLPQLRRLAGTPTAAPPTSAPEPTARPADAARPPVSAVPAPSAASPRPALPTDVPEFFLRAAGGAAAGTLRPAVLGIAKLHFVDAKTKTDAWVTRSLIAPIAVTGDVVWEEAEARGDLRNELDTRPPAGAAFEPLPSAAIHPRSAADWRKLLAAHLYQEQTLAVLQCPELKLSSRVDEEEGDFRARIALAQREKRDADVDKIKAAYAPRIQRLGDQVRRAEERVEREKAQVGQQRVNTALSFGSTLLGALLGRRRGVGTVSRATTAMRSASRIGKEKADVERANEGVDVLQERLAELNRQFEEEIAALQADANPATVPLESVALRPRKSDITISVVGLCWRPVQA
jgi:hypothetical protein